MQARSSKGCAGGPGRRVTTANPRSVTRREIEVLALVGARLSNAEIAGRLHLSVRTVENHLSSLLRKYGVADRRALAEVAAQVAAGVPDPGGLAGAPATLTRFIGRDFERALLLGALRDGRLVTLHGPGGVGKTRLAVEVAQAAGSLFPSRRMFIDLIPARDGYVAQAVAAALGVSERPGESLQDAIAARMGDGRFLLILDNCEHVIDAAAAFTERLLSACPGVRILATSRERLGIRGERTVRLGPLPLGSDAEILFTDRAAVADPEFAADPAAVAEICARLDGLPMATELAAARIPALSVGGILAGLDDSLRLVAGGRGADARHHSLRAVIGWSYDLLDDEERRFFRHLAVFAGTFSLKAALAVISARDRATVADLLGRLVDKSLVVHQPGTLGRWRLLDTVRAFATDRLRANGEEAHARERHRACFAAYAAELERRIGGQWRDEFDTVACDLRAALAGCPPGPDPVAHGLARALGHLTFARRFLQESLGHYEQAAAHAPSPRNAAHDLADAAGCALLTDSSGDSAFELLLAAADQACRAGDGDAQAIALARAVEIAARHTGSYPAMMPGERLKDVLQLAATAGDPAHPPVAAALAADPSRHLSFATFVDARCAAHTGELARAEELVSRAFGDLSRGWYAAYAQAAAAELAVIANLPGAAQHLAAAAPAAQENAWAAACLDRTAGRLQDDPSTLASAIKGWERISARFERACTLLLLPERASEGHAELQRPA